MAENRTAPWHGEAPGRPVARTRRLAATGFERWLIARLLRAAGDPPVRFLLWDGSEISGRRPASWTVTVHDRATLVRLALDPHYAFGEAYSSGRLEVEGDLVEMLAELFRGGARRSRLASIWAALPRHANSLAGSRRNIHHHYDLGNDFYRLWLDREMLYTCAYYPRPGMTLEEAQVAKMELVCRKLRLQPGERVVEAGGGWGGLALYMARQYGVHVTSYNISHQQVEYARARLEREGPTERVRFVEDDYRAITGEYDVFVSVGMLEHVGPRHYADLARVIDRVLGPDGRGLIHTIGRNRHIPLNPWIERRIFPGAYPPTLAEMAPLFERADLSVLDVENLRLHYALTLRHWLERYEREIDEVREMFDERLVRAWRLYLAGSIAAFEAGTLQLFQATFQRARSNRLPMSRAELYRGEPGSAAGE